MRTRSCPPEARPRWLSPAPGMSAIRSQDNGPLSINWAMPCAFSAPCPRRTCLPSTAPPLYSSFPACMRGSACPCWRQWPAARRSPAPIRQACQEVTGEAARLFNPHSVTEIKDAITELLEDGLQRTRRSEQGLAQSGRFSWQATAAATLRCYRELLGVKK